MMPEVLIAELTGSPAALMTDDGELGWIFANNLTTPFYSNATAMS